MNPNRLPKTLSGKIAYYLGYAIGTILMPLFVAYLKMLKFYKSLKKCK